MGETCASAPRDPAARLFSPRSSRAISPLCLGTADEIDVTSDDAHVPVPHCRPAPEVARGPGTADSPTKVVGDSLAIVLRGLVAIAATDALGPAGTSEVELERLGGVDDVGVELKT